MDLLPVTIDRPRGLSDAEQATLHRLLDQLLNVQRRNRLKSDYYDAHTKLKDLGISVPPALRTLETVVGWPGTVVDVLEERLQHDGWDGRDLGVDDIVEANHLTDELAGGRLDALIYGVSFLVVGRGQAGEPDPLVTVEPPTRMTATWDRRRRAVSEALLVGTDSQGELSSATLWTETDVIELVRDGQLWQVTERSAHSIGRPPVERLVNRGRPSQVNGRSEITRPVRTLTDNGVRTLLGSEVTREFYAAPQLWLLGADESAFVDAEGKPKSVWETYIGRIKAIGRDADGDLPDVKQFAGASPQPFWEQLRGLSQLLSAEAGMPTSYLGIVTDNPPSADSTRALESRLISRAQRRIAGFGQAEARLMRLAVWVRDGRDPGVNPAPIYLDPSTHTPAAQADAAVKLVGAGILPPDSDVTLRRVGLNARERDSLQGDLRRARAAAMVAQLADVSADAG